MVMSERWTADAAQAAVDAHLTEHLDESIEELARFCRQPSVAAQGLGIAACAELTATLLREHGFRAEIMASDGNPVVYGELDVVAPTARDLELLAQLQDNAEQLKPTFGLEHFLGDATGVDLRRQQVFVPTCTIAGLTSGYQGPGLKTVLPAEARAKVDFRLVPEQDPADLLTKLRRHLDRHGFADVAITPLSRTHAARVDPDSPFVQLVAEAAWDTYDKPLLIAPMIGGSGPMYPFVKYLNVPIANSGIGQPDSNAHAPNENVAIDEFLRGMRHAARILERMPEL